MELPDTWEHRTGTRSWRGPLPGVGAGDTASAEARRRQRNAAIARAVHVLNVLTFSDFRARYRAQALGIVWSLLSPLVMMTIMSLVFTRVFRAATEHFPIFLLIGLLVWEWVSTGINAATHAFVASADVVKRTVFAREMLPVSAILSHGINFALAGSLLLIFIPIFPGAFRLTPALLVVPLLLGVLAIFMVGIGLATSVLNVVYRDVAYLVNTALLILYWLTPIMYPLEFIPEPYRSVLAWNPIGGVVIGLRGAIMTGQVPAVDQWWRMLAPTLIVAGAGWVIFRRHERLVLDYV